MKLITSLWNLVTGLPCEHRQTGNSCFCPDCGCRVKTAWQLLECQQCRARRVPQKSWWGLVQPLEPYCRHCGTNAVKVVYKAHIEAFELLYALPIKVLDLEPVVEGQVLRKKTYQKARSVLEYNYA